MLNFLESIKGVTKCLNFFKSVKFLIIFFGDSWKKYDKRIIVFRS